MIVGELAVRGTKGGPVFWMPSDMDSLATAAFLAFLEQGRQSYMSLMIDLACF
jgi:hypothetical protein